MPTDPLRKVDPESRRLHEPSVDMSNPIQLKHPSIRAEIRRNRVRRAHDAVVANVHERLPEAAIRATGRLIPAVHGPLACHRLYGGGVASST